jgi:hypothetical protein
MFDRTDVAGEIQMISGRTYEYCLTAWNILKSNAYRWHSELNTDAERTISRMFYQSVFDTLPDKTGLSTVADATSKDEGMTDDHYMAPQTVAKFIMERPELLNNYEKFEEIFLFCRKTVAVTKEQNLKLAQITKKQPVLTKDKYHYLGYDLYFEGEKLPEHNQVLDVPEDFTEWESKFIKNDFRPTTVYIPEVSTLEEFLV